MNNLLKELGLTDIEARVYLALIKNGSSLAGKISSDTGIHRRTVYDAIERLIEKGLVIFISTNNKKYFEAVNPRRLLEMIKEREDALNKVLPELEKEFNFVKEKKETLFFRGKKALQAIFNQQMRIHGDIFYSGSADVLVEIYKLYLRKYNAIRKENGVKLNVLTDSSAKGIWDDKRIWGSSFRYLDSLRENKTVISLYEGNLAIIRWTDEPIAILIKEKDIEERFKDYFQILWKIAKK